MPDLPLHPEPDSAATQVAALLASAGDGDPRAAADLLPLVYRQLRQLARARLAREAPGHTLQATALVHEAFLRLVGDADGAGRAAWDGRGHFFAAAAEAMRRILVDAARRRRTLKRGGNIGRSDMDVDRIPAPNSDADHNLLALDAALGRLAKADPAEAELVRLRYFAGLTVEEAARVLRVSVATANRRWAYAKAWLHRELSRGGAAPDAEFFPPDGDS